MQQSALAGLAGQPLAAGHKMDTLAAEHLRLALPYLVRQVATAAAAGQQRAMVTARLEMGASAGIMADG